MGTTRESRNGRPRAPRTGEVGTSHAWGTEGVHPSDFLGKPKRPEPADLKNMLAVDGWASAMYEAITWPIRRAGWSIVEEDGDTGEAELCREQLGPLMRGLIARMCQAIAHGVLYAELVWDLGADGTVVLNDVAPRPIETCRALRDRHGRVTGFKQVAFAQTGVVNEEFLIAERKAFVYAHDSTSGDPSGRSAFETAHHYFRDKQKAKFYRFKNLEKFGGPTTHGKTRATGSQREAFEKAVRDARSGAAIITDPDDELAYLTVPNAGNAFRQTITDLNFEMAVSTMVQWLAYAQEGNSGSYNASEVQHSVLEDVTEGRMAEMADAARELCRHVCELNRGLRAVVPRIEAESIAEEPKERVRTAAELLFGKRKIPGWLAEAVTEAWARQMDIEKPEGAPTLDPEPEPAQEVPPPANQPPPPRP